MGHRDQPPAASAASPVPGDLEALKLRLRRFADDRGWAQFHSPKNLAMALSVEASELLEVFQWLTEEQSGALDEAQRRRATEEIADVLNYLVRLADRLGVNLLEAAAQKIEDNERKYPAGLVRGQSRKYDEYK